MIDKEEREEVPDATHYDINDSDYQENLLKDFMELYNEMNEIEPKVKKSPAKQTTTTIWDTRLK